MNESPDIVLGIDPGFTGGWAVVNREFGLVSAGKIPCRKPQNLTEVNARVLADILDGTGARLAYVEFVTSRPRQAHQFRFGLSTGVIHGVLETLGIQMKLVSGPKWKAGVGLGQRAVTEHTGEFKKRSRALASKIWPDQANLFARTLDDGVAEAALIALYGMGAEQNI